MSQAITSSDMYRASPRTVRRWVERCINKNVVPFVQGSPGVGKSSIMRNVAKAFNLKLIDHRLSTSSPEDMSGLPHFVNGYARFAPFEELFPVESTPIPADKDGWLIFLDEFNSGSLAVQAASYKIILDKMVGQVPLHPNVVIALAGNLVSDRAITNRVSTALQSRVAHMEIYVDFEEWLYDVALPEQYDPRVVSYLSQHKGKLMDFRPDHNEKTFCCPRTWEFVDRLISGEDILRDEDTGLLAGTITSGTAADFVTYTKVYKNLVTIKEILGDPLNCSVPPDTNSKWAIISMMMEHVSDKMFGDLSLYANRFSLDMRVLFFRAAMVRKPELRSHPALAKAMLDLHAYLKG